MGSPGERLDGRWWGIVIALAIGACRRWDPTCEPAPIWSVDLVRSSGQPITEIAWKTDGAATTALAIGVPFRQGAPPDVTLGGVNLASPIVATIGSDGQVAAIASVEGDPADAFGQIPSGIGRDDAGNVVVAWGIPSCTITHYVQGSFVADWSLHDPTTNPSYLRCQGLAVSAIGEIAYVAYDQQGTGSWTLTLLDPDGATRWTHALPRLPQHYDFYFAHSNFTPSGDVLVTSPTLGETLLAGSDGHVVAGPAPVSLATERDGATATVSAVAGIRTIAKLDVGGNEIWSRIAPLQAGSIALTPAGDVLIGGTVPDDVDPAYHLHPGNSAVMLLTGSAGGVIASEERCSSLQFETIDGGYVSFDSDGDPVVAAQLAMHALPRLR